jgi:prepilin-type N-terminal cleavage/methylation domain-containing protein
MRMSEKILQTRICIALLRHTTYRVQKGFTLVELMVSLSIFSIVMVISIGTLLIMIDANAKAQALSSTNVNLSIALDSMTRTIRTGYHYYCNASSDPDTVPPDSGSTRYRSCPTNESNHIALTRGDTGNRIAYRLQNGAIEVKEVTSSGSVVYDWTPITSADITIARLEFKVTGANPYCNNVGCTTPDATQPQIQLTIEGSATANNGLAVPTTFLIQTHMTQQRQDYI